MARFVALAALVLAASCTGKDPYNPGQGIGMFHVSAQLVSTTCGTTPNPWEFDVKLRHDAQTLYWVQGGAPVQGTLDASAHATLTSANSSTLREANEQKKLASCVVTRSDSLEILLDKTDPSAADALTGTLGYAFVPASGSDCSDQTTATGGDFDALPCEVHYTLSAKRTGDVK
jgi:hypothetical protein